ncbi:MAG: response regulator [Clostridia bacterium]|nr:response regulator [Clostridia bacterium]
MYNVLIVEDDPMVAMINEQYVNRHKDFKVVGKCKDGELALSYIQENPVDLIILDVFMPRMNGFETLRELRKEHKSVDVIMVTAANDRESLEEALHLGIVDYLVKPFTFDRFKIALDKFISQKKLLQDFDTLNQSNIDFIIDKTKKTSQDVFPKGIQDKTLQAILSCLKNNRSKEITSDFISEQTGLTAVTVRRYMSYLEENGTVIGELNYETGGRPCMYYYLKENE